MLIIEYKKATASWDEVDLLWKSDDKVFAEVLNQSIPREAYNADAPFLINGVEGVALRGAKNVIGDKLRVILFEPRPAPEEEEGVDY